MSDQAPVLDPKRTALLVMDFQQGVLRRLPGLEPLVARVQGAIADMRAIRSSPKPRRTA